MQDEITVREIKDSDGRTQYVLADMVTVCCKEEADALAQTGVHQKLQCPVTQGLLFAFRRQVGFEFDPQPYTEFHGRGLLVKFPWE